MGSEHLGPPVFRPTIRDPHLVFYSLPATHYSLLPITMANLEVKIPPMGESINSGVLAKWHVNNGDVVKKDQPLFELETDKITSEGTAVVTWN